LFTVGGPIEIPKVIHGKDRFFSSSLQGRQVQQQSQAAVNVFTPTELSGDTRVPTQTRTGQTRSTGLLDQFPFFQSDPAKRTGIMTRRNQLFPKTTIAAGLIPSQPTHSVSLRWLQMTMTELTGKFDAVLIFKDRLAVTLVVAQSPAQSISVKQMCPGFRRAL